MGAALFDLCTLYNIPLWNHFCDTTFSLHHELFEDPIHLNSAGEDLYSKTIFKEIKSYLADPALE